MTEPSAPHGTRSTDRKPTIETDQLRTARLSLRPLVRSDAAAMAALSNDPAVVDTLSFLTYPVTEADIENWIGAQPDLREWQVACRAWDGRLVGIAGIHPDDRGGAEIGFWLGRDQWGQGFATEIAQAIAGLAKERGYLPIWAVVLPDNLASIRVLEKCGFVRDGEARRFYRQRAEELTVHRFRLPDGPR